MGEKEEGKGGMPAKQLHNRHVVMGTEKWEQQLVDPIMCQNWVSKKRIKPEALTFGCVGTRS